MLYLITYDLRTPGRDYTDLTKRLKAIGAIAVLQSTWLFASNDTSANVRDAIARDGRLDANDGLLVTEQHNNAAWRGGLMADDNIVKAMYQRAR